MFTGTYAYLSNVHVADGQDSVMTKTLIVTINYHKIRNLKPTTCTAFGTSNMSATNLGPFGTLSTISVYKKWKYQRFT
jgi:hypothetical protein